MAEKLIFEKDMQSSFKGPVTVIGQRLLRSLYGDQPVPFSIRATPSVEEQAFDLNTAIADRITTNVLYEDLMQVLSQSDSKGEDSTNTQ